MILQILMQVADASINVILSSIQDHGNNCLLQTSSVPMDTSRDEMKTVIIYYIMDIHIIL